MYLTYEKYQELGGVLSEDAFRPLCREACAQIDYYTFGRLKQDTAYSDAVQQCCYALIGILDDKHAYTSPDSAQVSSRSNNGLSESYAVVSLKDALEATGEEMAACIDTYLADETNAAGDKLLYRGAAQ